MAVPTSQMTRGKPMALSAQFRSTSPEAALTKHPPSWGSARVAAGHRRLLRPCGHQLPKRVPCPRPRAQRMAARAGRFPAGWLPVPSPGRPSGTGRLGGAAGCPAWERPQGSGPSQAHSPWPLPSRAQPGCPRLGLQNQVRRGLPPSAARRETEAWGLAHAPLRCCRRHTRPRQPEGAQHAVCAKPLAPCRAKSKGS